MEEKDTQQQATDCLQAAERAFRRVHSALPEYAEAIYQVLPFDSLGAFSAAPLMAAADWPHL